MLNFFFFFFFCCKSLKFSKKENQEKGCALMNKERQKQTRALFHLFPCYRFFSNLCLRFLCLTHLWPTFPFYIPPKNLRTTPSLWPPEDINWEHHQPNETIIDWPKYDEHPHSMTPGNIIKPKPSSISRGTQNQKISKKRVKWQHKNNRRLTASKNEK